MRRLKWWIIVACVLGAAGCSSTKPCMVIPAQVELANDGLEAARYELDREIQAMERWNNAIQQSTDRLARLTEDRDRLLKQIGESPEEEK